MKMVLAFLLFCVGSMFGNACAQNADLLDSKVEGTLPDGIVMVFRGSMDCFKTPVLLKLTPKKGKARGRLYFLGHSTLPWHLKTIKSLSNGNLQLTLNESFGRDDKVYRNNKLMITGTIKKDGSYVGTYIFTNGTKGKFLFMPDFSPEDNGESF
jgi:hypothetical protein